VLREQLEPLALRVQPELQVLKGHPEQDWQDQPDQSAPQELQALKATLAQRVSRVSQANKGQ
jgi:hypothetical protein